MPAVAYRTGRIPDHLFIGESKMAKSTKATATPTRNPDVGSLIGDAGRAAATMLQKCKEAAAMASAQLDPKKPIGARVDRMFLRKRLIVA